MVSGYRERVWHTSLKTERFGVLTGEGNVSAMSKIIVAFGLRFRQRRLVHLCFYTQEIAIWISCHEVDSALFTGLRVESHLRLIGIPLFL